MQNRLVRKDTSQHIQANYSIVNRLSKSHGKEIDDDTYMIATQFTNRKLANMIGSSRETKPNPYAVKKSDCIGTDENGAIIVFRDKLEDDIF